MQALVTANNATRFEFAKLFLQQRAAESNINTHVLFKDECGFTSEGTSKSYNCHVWSTSNLHDALSHAHQK